MIMGYLKRLGHEQPASYYDRVYAMNKKRIERRYRGHYSKSGQYGIWKIVVGMVRSLHIEDPSILEIACGTGQLAHYLEDEGFGNYLGIDFSRTAIDIGRKMSRQSLAVGNAKDPALYKDKGYDIVIAIEFFEHVKADIGIIKMIEPGTNIIFSVPIGGGCAHVRRFRNEKEIRLRYGKFMTISQIKRFGDDHIWFICKAVKKNL
jgi:2-polyprenyl-3-methyl-5-hydroxy-6-metoxy-1,4-benzoquinol methylase